MAKDKVKLYIDVININALTLEHWRYSKNTNSFYWWYKTDKYYLKYSLISGSKNLGHLTIDFSVSKIINDNNALPVTHISADKLQERLQSDLKTVLNFDMIQDFKEWIISKDETFIDIIASKEVIASLYHLIEYSTLSRRRVDTTYKDQGTLYIHSSKDRKSGSWTLIAYDKVREGANKGVDIAKVKGLKEGQGCLRLELKTKGYSLKDIIKKHKKCIQSKNAFFDYRFLKNNNYKYIMNSNYKYSTHHKTALKAVRLDFNEYEDKYPTTPSIVDYRYDFKQIDTTARNYLNFDLQLNSNNATNKKLFTYSLNLDFQFYILFDTLNKLHLLDKDILTRSELFAFIDSSSRFKSKTKKENAKKAVRSLNGKRVKNKPSSKTETKYKKELLNSGVHYVYVKDKIPKIDTLDLFDAIYKTGELILE